MLEDEPVERFQAAFTAAVSDRHATAEQVRRDWERAFEAQLRTQAASDDAVEAAPIPAAEPILLVVPGHERGAPKIGDTLIPDLLPGQWTWIPRRGARPGVVLERRACR